MGDERLLQDYRRDDGRASLPMMHVSLDITYRCNHRCGMCFLYGDHLNGDNSVLRTIHTRKEMTIKQWKDVISEIHGLGVRSVVMTGGEILLKKNVLELVRFAKEKGLYVTLLSNGSMITEDVASEIVSAGPDFLRFSLHGDREAHDEICGAPNYDRLMAAIDRITNDKISRKARLPELGFECVIQKRNQQSLRHVAEIAVEKRIMHLVMSNIFFTPLRENRSSQKTRYIGPDFYGVDVDVLWNELCEVRKLTSEHGIKFCCRMKSREDVENIYYNPRFSYLNKCLYPWLMCRINPYGDVIPCTGSTLGLGNVLERPLAEIWNSRAYCKLRRDIKKAGLFPECVKCNTLESERWKEWNNIV